MNWNEEKQKFEDLTAEEQRLADLMYKKGFGQAAKKYEQQPEVANNTTQAFDMSEMQKMMAEAVAAAVAPIKQELETTKQDTIEAKKQSFLAKQETKLTPVYASLVTGATEEEWAANYKKVAEQFKQDLKQSGVTASFAAPISKEVANIHTPSKKFSEMSMAEKMDLCRKDPELYTRLKKQNK